MPDTDESFGDQFTTAGHDQLDPPRNPESKATEAICANCNGTGTTRTPEERAYHSEPSKCPECDGTGEVPLGTRLEQLDRSGEHHTGEPHSHGHSDLEEIEGAVEADDGTGNYATCSACHRVMNGTGCVGYLEIDGKRYERLGFGENGEGTEDGCPDCYVKEYGAKHHWGCDNETCPSCQGQALGCDCDSFELIVDGTESKAEEHGWDLPENPTKSQIKKAIKKLQMFIHYAGMENPMHMGEFREELAELEARLASANEMEFDADGKYLSKARKEKREKEMQDAVKGGFPEPRKDWQTQTEREYEEWADNPNTWCDRCGNDGCDYCKDKGIGIYYKKNKGKEDWQKHLPVGMTIRGYECPICFMSIKFEKEFGGTGKNLYNHLLERHGVDDSEAQDMVQTAKSGVKDDYEKVFQDYESPYGEADSKSNQNIKNLKLRNQKRQWGRRGESIDTIKSLGVGGDDIDTNPKYHGKSLEELLKIKEEYFGTIGNLDLGDDPDMSDYDDLNWEIGLLQGEYTGEGVGDFFKKLSGRGDQTWGSDPITHGDFEIMWNNADVQQRIKWLEDVQGSADGLQNESYDKLPQWVQVQLFYHTGDLDQHEDLLETPNISLESYDYYSPKKSKPRTKYSSNKAHKMRKGTGELTKDNLLKHIKSEGTYDPEENNTYNTASSVRNKTDRYLQELESEGWIEQKMQSNKLVWVPTRHGSGRTGNIGEGGNGSGRKFHQQWMNDADKIDSIKSDDMTKDKFLKRAKAIEIEYTDEDQYRRMFEQLKDG
jgi:hypothetical protein